MSTKYSPGCMDDKAHTCDQCNQGDGRPTLYWVEQDFDICYPCLSSLYVEHVACIDKQGESIKVCRKRITEDIRAEVFSKDGGVCICCGLNENLQVDHIIPFSKGGKTTLDNFQTLCKSCNAKKGAK